VPRRRKRTPEEIEEIFSWQVLREALLKNHAAINL
jgi:hypothetical protein